METNSDIGYTCESCLTTFEDEGNVLQHDCGTFCRPCAERKVSEYKAKIADLLDDVTDLDGIETLSEIIDQLEGLIDNQQD